MKTMFIDRNFTLAILLSLAALLTRCDNTGDEPRTVPHDGRWGVYELDLATENTRLIYSTSEKITGVQLNDEGSDFVFSKTSGGTNDNYEEIFTMGIDGSDLTRLTNNNYLDVYPMWSPDGSEIAFLSIRDTDLDIYVMDKDGDNTEKLFDSGTNDADIHWVSNKICYTSNSQIWTINSNGLEPFQVTDPPNAGQWGDANLPFGDYDPRLSPDGAKIVFERLTDDISLNGNYDIYVIDSDGSGENALTNNGNTQGLASWSHSGDKIIYIVSAIANEGKYDIYMMNSDGTDNHSITPNYFDPLFLIHSCIFSQDDSKIYFIGEWWE
ncbi:MAG: hypothetical protein V1775_07700 [Bacteroidota bacterium]